MLVYIREKKTFEALDFRETAPGRIQSGVYDMDNNASRYGKVYFVFANFEVLYPIML